MRTRRVSPISSAPTLRRNSQRRSVRPTFASRAIGQSSCVPIGRWNPENSRDGYHATLLHKRLRGLSPPKPFKLYPNGHAVQRLGLDYDAARKAGTLDGILAEQPELADRFMTNPLPGVTLEDSSRIITIFPDVLIAIRYSTVLIVKQIPISAEATWFETRYAYLADDSAEQIDLRRKHWNMYWAEDGGNLPEDWEA
jgi:hypothetical protein